MALLTSNRCKLLSKSFLALRGMCMFRNVQEVRIPMPLGHLAGKWWGPPEQRPIVALHGWQDSCGSFDRLIPLLSEDISFLALDSPGHGHSYKLPAGIPYRNTDAIILLKQLRRYFGWQKITLMGHSLGAIQAFSYGSLFPKYVDFMICLDCVHPFITSMQTQNVVNNIEKFLKYDALRQSTNEPPTYTMEEMVEKLHLATKKSIAIDTAEYILRRNIKESEQTPGKYYFNRDPRLKVDPLLNEDHNHIVAAASHVTFPILICKFSEGSFLGDGSMFQEVYKAVSKSSVHCEFHEIPGTHHAHLNEPSLVAHYISNFIQQHDVEDRGVGGMNPGIMYDELIHGAMEANPQPPTFDAVVS
ncbi:putative nucleic acid binding protein [Trypoxylus dichotomus]